MSNSNLIKKAVSFAGGAESVASHFGLTDRAVRKWWQVNKVPTDHIYSLCKKGGFKVKPSDLNSKSFPNDVAKL
jgi:hypothetical protein